MQKDGVYMAMWDFTVDSEIQTELSQHLKGKADAFDAQVKNMYGKVNELSQHWVGEDYNAFKNGTESYSKALQDLSDGIRMYANHFDKIVEGTDSLATELINIINDMTMTESSIIQDGAVDSTLPSTPGAAAGAILGVNTALGNVDNSTTSSSEGVNGTNNSGTNGKPISSNSGEQHKDETPTTTNNSGIGNTDNSTASSSDANNNNSSEPKVVEDGYFSKTWIAGQVTAGAGIETPFYLTDDNSIYYQDGKIYYPDGHFEERSLKTYQDYEQAWKDINGYVYKSEFKTELPIKVPEGYTLVDDFSKTWLGIQTSDGVDTPFYLTDNQSIYYQDGKIYYPDGHFEERNLRNYYDREKAWKEINKYVYESDCR